jgi:hypothetical protein
MLVHHPREGFSYLTKDLAFSLPIAYLEDTKQLLG